MHRLSRLISLVLFACALLLAVAPGHPTPLAAPGNSAFGVNSHVGSRHGDLETINDAMDLVVATDTGWVREEFQWGLVDETRSGTYNWDVLDATIGELHAQGVNIIGLLNDAPGFAPTSDTARQGFLAFVSAAVERYPEVTHWEVWNEPENALYWNPPDVAAYTRLLQAASQAIKAANPNAQVISAGIVPTHADFIRGIHENGGWDSFDILGLHPYVDPFTPEGGQIGNGGDVEKIRSLVQELGNKPIWATEYGWSTGPADRLAGGGAPVDQETQANYLVRGATLLRVAELDHIIWFKLKDEHENNRYGLFDLAGGGTDFSQPKAAYAAFTTLNQQIGTATPVETLQPGQASIVLDFNTPLEWTSGNPSNGTLTHSTAQARSGSAGELSYNAATSGNDFVGFNPSEEIAIPGTPSQLGIWVYGNGSGLELWAWLRDAEGEILKYRLGIVGTGDWRFISIPINETLLDWQVDNDTNRRVDFPATLVGFALEDNPDTDTGSGTIYIDDLTAMSGAYGVRFSKGGGVVDVLWALTGEQVSIPTDDSTGTLVDRDGNETTVNASGGEFSLTLGPAPVYLNHAGGALPQPSAAAPPPRPTIPPTPAPGDEPTPSPTTPTPVTDERPDFQEGACRAFPETGFEVCGRLLEYWNENGGLPVFGYPITQQREEQIEGQPLQVQWFERNRLELHPENARPYDVLLGRLGEDVLVLQGRNWMDEFPTSQEQAGCRYFAETGHNVCGEILAAWRSNGLELDGAPGVSEGESLALFGLPLGDAAMETVEGEEYMVQWFERARFELHPENAPPNNVLLGLLGNEMREAGGIE
jgi:hypothetical protein